jgi:hypothetical protein
VQEKFPTAYVVELGSRSVARSGTFPFQFEDDHTGIVSGREQILRRVRGENPKAIAFTAKGLDADTFADIPNTDRAIFRIGDDKIVFGMKQAAGHIVGVSPEGIDFPGLGFAHTPQLDLSIIRCRGEEWQSRVEGRPVNASVMTFEYILDDNIVGSEQLGLHVKSGGRRTHGSIHVSPTTGLTRLFLTETGGIPHPDRLIQRR